MEGEAGAADSKEETAKRHTYALIRVILFKILFKKNLKIFY